MSELTWATSPNNAATQTDAATLAKWEIWFLVECLLGIVGWTSTTSTSVGSGQWTQTGAGWTVNAFAGWTLIDSLGARFSITGNTSSQLTLASGTPTSGTGMIAPGPWQPYYSCDGTTAGTPSDYGTASADRWGGATFTSGKIVQASGAVAHSWFVLKSPNNFANSANWYLIVDCNSGTSNIVSLTLCKTAPTGGGPTARPTSTDEIKLQANDGSTQDAFNNTPTGTPAAQHYMHVSQSTRGDTWIWESYATGGFAYALWGVTALQDNADSDTYSAVGFYSGNNNLTTSLPTGSSGWQNPGNSNLQGRVPASGSNATVKVAALAPQLSSGALFGDMTGADSVNSKYDNFPIYCYQNTTGKSLKGRLADVSWCPTSIASGTVAGSTTPYSLVSVAGAVWMPWACSTAPLT